MPAFLESARWISGAPYDYGMDDAGYFGGHLEGVGHRNHVLHRRFEVNRRGQASLHVAVLGYARIWLNGTRVGSAELLGDWTNYAKLVYYDTFDVTGLLREGTNEFAIELGNGWYNPSPLTMFGKYNLRARLAEVGTPAVLVSLDIDGEMLVSSDETWTYSEGPLLFNNVYLGETWDLMWQGSDEHPVTARNDTRTLTPSVVERCRAFPPVESTGIRTLDNGAIVVDFGQILTGFADVTFEAHAGDVITFRYAETADEEGVPTFASSLAGLVGERIPDGRRVPGGPGAPEQAQQVDRVICSEGKNHLRNAFCVHSCRFMQIEGLPVDSLTDASFIPVHTDLAVTGSLSTGSAWYDELLDAAIRTKLNNIHGVWEDCARERLGYGGDMIALALSNLMSFDCERLIRKTVRDFRNDQTPTGGVPETAPFMGIGTHGTGYGEGPILWQLAYPHLILRAYQYYGCRDLVAEEWPYVRRLIDYLLEWNPEELAGHCIGDHGALAVGGNFATDTPDKMLVGWCTIARFARAAVRFCQILGEDGTAYQRRLDRLRADIRARFAHHDGTWGDGTQTGLAFVADLGLGDAQALGDALATKVAEEGGILSTGIFGSTIAFDLLHRTGHSDVVETWLNRVGPPSFHAMLASGNHALAEQFETMLSSFNHAMFSSYVQWLYQGLAGIVIADDAVACNHVLLCPHFSDLTDRVECSFETRLGAIRTRWERSGNEVSFFAEVPSGIRADVVVPEGVTINVIEV